MIYDFSCPICQSLLAVSSASAELLKQGGIGICDNCAPHFLSAFNGKELPESLSQEYRDSLSRVLAKMLETLEELKTEKATGVIVDIVT